MKKLLLAVLSIILLVALFAWFVGSAQWASRPELRDPVSVPRPIPASGKQILFGDLHTHTSYSMDAAIFGTPVVKDTGYVTPADACDFARYCSALDFWSINDHAESIAPWQWQATKQAIRQCNAASDPANPDMVSFLGWEWSQGGETPDTHYGHKNVIFREATEANVPTRPIASTPSIWRQLSEAPAPLRGLGILSASKVIGLGDYASVAEHLQAGNEAADCGDGDVRELPDDCFETAATPKQLFAKLDQWGFDALVIPHGLAWGTTNPVGADFASQMDQHDSRYQRLLEVYSGHGNSEVYRPLDVTVSKEQQCSEPVDGYTQCCWQAGEIIRQRCESQELDDCEQRASQARDSYMAAWKGGFSNPAKAIVPDSTVDEWAQCNQLTDAFQPAHDYQPRNSAQYIYTLGDNNNRAEPNRARMGLIGSSDNHTARAGSSYKEFARYYMTDTKDVPTDPEFPVLNPAAASLDPEDLNILSAWTLPSNKSAFYFSGGLVAVHSDGRDRQAIWDALQRREVYGTSGPRMALWFDLIDTQGKAHPMGSELWSVGNPRFRVRAMGSQRQLPGCPDYADAALGAGEIERLCRGECYNPDDTRHAITRIEIVRILPQFHEGEQAAELIQDPWRSFDCEPDSEACEAEFDDPDFGGMGREAVYYARAIQEATPTINGAPFRCEYNAAGECIKTNYCLNVAKDEDCLSPAQHRAWSSPIFVQFAGE